MHDTRDDENAPGEPEPFCRTDENGRVRRREGDDPHPDPFYRVGRDGRLSCTEEGLRAFRRRFDRSGIPIETVRTFEDYRTAMRLSAGLFVEDTLEQLAERARGKPWRELLEAAFAGDAEAIARAKRRYETRLKLKVVSGSSE